MTDISKTPLLDRAFRTRNYQQLLVEELQKMGYSAEESRNRVTRAIWKLMQKNCAKVENEKLLFSPEFYKCQHEYNTCGAKDIYALRFFGVEDIIAGRLFFAHTKPAILPLTEKVLTEEEAKPLRPVSVKFSDLPTESDYINGASDYGTDKIEVDQMTTVAIYGGEAGAKLRESILKIQQSLATPEERMKMPIRSGNGWRSLNTIGMIRAQQIEQNLSFHRGIKGLGELYPDGEKLWELMTSPLSKKELLQYYNRNARFRGNNRKLKNKFL